MVVRLDLQIGPVRAFERSETHILVQDKVPETDAMREYIPPPMGPIEFYVVQL